MGFTPRGYEYGSGSLQKLSTCHPVWRRIANRALKLSQYDIIIVCGHRGKEIQDAYYEAGKSMKKWPNSRHNRSDDPYQNYQDAISDAIDFAPYVNGRINWEDAHIFSNVAGCFMTVANDMAVRLRWGGDWDGDGESTDQRLMDWGHLEIDWED